MRLPSPPPEAASSATDPRIAEVQRAIDARAGAARLQAIHPYGARRPEQCLGLIDWGFVNQTYLAYQRIPTYYEWYLNADQRPVYEHHKRFLQHLQFRNPGDWVLKWPKHLFGLDALLEVYPDARIVWTHRDPGTVIPSSVSFVGTLRAMNSPVFDPEAVRRRMERARGDGAAPRPVRPWPAGRRPVSRRPLQRPDRRPGGR